MTDSDGLLFAAEEPEEELGINASKEAGSSEMDKWKILIVDDDKEVHSITRLVLAGKSFDGKTFNLVSAYSAEEAKRILQQESELALVLLDVVMEEDDSGLQLVRYIRRELQNPHVRIVLRTGYPGQAPEDQVVVDYDINDYAEKTELTSRKLFATVIASLRAYRDIMVIESSRLGLSKIVEASGLFYDHRTAESFSTDVLDQLSELMNRGHEGFPCHTAGFQAEKTESGFVIKTGSGYFADKNGELVTPELHPEAARLVEKTCQLKFPVSSGIYYAVSFHTEFGEENVLFMETCRALSELDKGLIDTFMTNVAIAFDNLKLQQEIDATQKETIFALCDVIESRSDETGNHVRRVAQYCKLLGEKYGLSQNECLVIESAAPLHDVGKVGIPDAILNKPGRLTDAEMAIMRTHTTVGHNILRNSWRPLLRAASVIALEHHEHWDGNGYPNKKAGEEIHIHARICSLADVYDALSFDRVYKKAWSQDKVQEHIARLSGKQFDPHLAQIFQDNIKLIQDIREEYRD